MPSAMISFKVCRVRFPIKFFCNDHNLRTHSTAKGKKDVLNVSYIFLFGAYFKYYLNNAKFKQHLYDIILKLQTLTLLMRLIEIVFKFYTNKRYTLIFSV